MINTSTAVNSASSSEVLSSISPNSSPTPIEQLENNNEFEEIQPEKMNNKEDILTQQQCSKANIDLVNNSEKLLTKINYKDLPHQQQQQNSSSVKAHNTTLNYTPTDVNNNYMSLPISLGTNNDLGNKQQSEYDMFLNQMALAASMNPSLLTAAASQSPKLNNNIGQQQLFAQTLAALAAVSINNTNNMATQNFNENFTSQNINQKSSCTNQNKSMLENIEILNSKFINQKQKYDQQQNLSAFNQNQIHSTPLSQNSLSSMINNSRLNSTPNYGFSSSNVNNDISKLSQKSSNKVNSISTSNSSFNLTDNNISNSSFENDDEVFSGSNSLNNSTASASLLMNSTNLQEALTLAFYQKLLTSNSNSSLNEFILNNSSQMSNDMINANNLQNYFNLASNLQTSAGDQLKTINTKNVNLPPATMALIKQRQNSPLNNRLLNNSNNLTSSNPTGNIAALTSATSNIASLLGQSNQQQNQYLKSNSTSSSQIGPNAAHLLQNSSLASSARLNTQSLSSTSTASVLGNNSQLSHALNPLQNPNSNHGLLSALSNNGSQMDSPLLSSTGKPLRSERLPQPVIDELVKQAKIRRRNGGKKEVCVFCRNNGEKEQIFTSHALKDASNRVACPILRLYQCPICHASGDHAHTIKYCPYTEKDSAYFKLFKDNGRMVEAATFFMNSLAGNETPPLSPPTGSTSSSAFFNPNNQTFNSFSTQDFNTSSSSLNDSSKQLSDLDLSLNKSFGSGNAVLQHNANLLAYNFTNTK